MLATPLKSSISKTLASAITLLLASAAVSQANAADWSDTSIGYRYGSKFAEPYNPEDISKNIFNLTHVSGYKYGSNYFNIDLLQSDSKDSNAQEAYVVYRNTLDLGKVTGKSLAFGPVRGVGITAGFDWNTKNDTGYASKKRMLVVGPTLMVDVPGFLDVSLLLLQESNFPIGVTSRYTYDLHPMLSAAWGIPISTSGFAFEGYMNYIASKGKNEYGGPTSPETNIDAMIMYDVGTALGIGKNTLRAGFEYQYWRNKFGNPSQVPGSLAKTPMARVEYHF
ncbi:nucleoside-specific outer membrane channel protein Tsx [Undibacterium sp. GrIS 1.8]|uniref:outer envelope protein n=1 Tax=Undibacterium sp. GrIS 1.8 TaxID=3143934 RepID=UPI003392DA59